MLYHPCMAIGVVLVSEFVFLRLLMRVVYYLFNKGIFGGSKNLLLLFITSVENCILKFLQTIVCFASVPRLKLV